MVRRRWENVRIRSLSQGEREALLADLDLRRGGDFQPASAPLQTIHELDPTSGATIVGDGSTWTTDSVPSSAWTAMSPAPTITATTGTFTSVAGVGKYHKVGKSCRLWIKITITTNGTAADDIRATLPFASLNDTVLHGAQFSGGNDAVYATIAASASLMRIRLYDGTYPGADGYVLIVSGTYETT